jgi:hypothetical protein
MTIRIDRKRERLDSSHMRTFFPASANLASLPELQAIAPPAATVRRWGSLVLLVLVGIAVATRLGRFVRAHSFWYDEAYMILNISGMSYADLCDPMPRDQAAPPLFLFALRTLYLIAGSSELALRLPALLASILAVVVAVPLASRLVGHPGSLWYVGFCALSFQGLTLATDVKPYTCDLLMTEMILWAGVVFFEHREARSAEHRPLALLLVLAFVGPWISYPSIFALSGVGAALAWQLRRAPRRQAIRDLSAFGLAVLISFGALWWFLIRHQRSDSLLTFWSGGFPDRSSSFAMVKTSVEILIGAGSYATTAFGILFLLFAPIGLAIIGRRSPSTALILAGMIGAAMMACILRRYPLADRLAFFAAPFFWLTTAAVIGAMVNRLSGWRGWCLLIVLAAIPAADLARIVPELFQTRSPAFREAQDYVRQTKQPDDRVWLQFPEVYEVYYGRDNSIMNCYWSNADAVAAATGHRLWMVLSRADSPQILDLRQKFAVAGFVVQNERRFMFIRVLLWVPQAISNSESSRTGPAQE